MSKIKWLGEIREVLGRDELRSWQRSFKDVRDESIRSAERMDELFTQESLMTFRAELAQKTAADVLYRAAGYEDLALEDSAAAGELENRAFEAIGIFEKQRVYVSELWKKVSALEHRLLEQREQVKKIESGADDDVARRKVQHRQAENELALRERDFKDANSVYERETARKTKMWDEVESLWARALEKQLLAAERKCKASSTRKTAESLFLASEENKKKSAELRAEAEKARLAREESAGRMSDCYDLARQKFDCVAGEDFLYWPQGENNKLVYAIALIEDKKSYNIPVEPLNLFQADRARGVDFLEAVEALVTKMPEERTLEGYFEGVQSSKIPDSE